MTISRILSPFPITKRQFYNMNVVGRCQTKQSVGHFLFQSNSFFIHNCFPTNGGQRGEKWPKPLTIGCSRGVLLDVGGNWGFNHFPWPTNLHSASNDTFICVRVIKSQHNREGLEVQFFSHSFHLMSEKEDDFYFYFLVMLSVLVSGFFYYLPRVHPQFR